MHRSTSRTAGQLHGQPGATSLPPLAPTRGAAPAPSHTLSLANNLGARQQRHAKAGTHHQRQANSTQSTFISKPVVAGKPQKLGDGIPGFQTSFNTSGKGGGSFRPISESFSVNQSNGTFSLSIPIPTTSSRGGFQPSLSLAYDSGSGNGPFGFGWNIGIASFSRKTSLGIPKYDGQDDFTYAGAEIVKTLKDNGSPYETKVGDYLVTRYRPRIDDQSLRMEKWESKTGDIYWKTISSNNVTSVFGDSNSSQVLDEAAGVKRVFSWKLSRAWDARGNCQEYSWKREDGKGIAGQDGVLPIWEGLRSADSRGRQTYLKRIKYGNHESNRDPSSWEISTWPKTWMFEVVFDYGEHSLASPKSDGLDSWKCRKDAFSQCHAGFEVRTYRLCQRVLMFHHFLDETNLPENLVASQEFHYDESPQRTLLDTITIKGHTAMGKGETDQEIKYNSESLPPWTFRYTDIPRTNEIQARHVNVANIRSLPTRSAVAEWLDLNGDGVPGLLDRLPDGTMTYQRNPGPDQDGTPYLCATMVLGQQPNASSMKTGNFQDLDRNGRLDLLCHDSRGELSGFYEREDSDTWSNYSSFPDTPHNEPELQALSLDMTGDGVPDMLYQLNETQQLVWNQNLGKQGQSERRHTSSPGSKFPPRLMKVRDTQTYVADLTGDGLSDLVEISAASITYWPNMGHGSFGDAVVMGSPPELHRFGAFDHSRIQLLDVDGSGTTDLLYVLPEGGAALFFNFAGNFWSDAVLIPMLPKLSSPSSVFALDIRGNGTAALCWAEDSTTSETTEIRYLDLMGDTKPHLLYSYNNGLGAQTSISYAPSTKYFVDDERQGHAWTTRLPFPVQVVSKSETSDLITGNVATSEYYYHNGCYDPFERQFAGFEMVESVFHESLVIGPEEEYRPPPSYSKSWFSVGLSLSVDRGRFFNASQLASTAAKNGDLFHEAYLALRGAKIRTEIYAQDGTAQANLPLSIEDYAYDILCLQGRGSNKHAVTQLLPQSCITTQYERDLNDPRVEHHIVLKTNSFGQTERVLNVVYPRGAKTSDVNEYLDVVQNQAAGNMTLITSQFTNSIDESNNFQLPVTWRLQDYEILSFPFNGILGVDGIRKFDFDHLPESKSATAWKILRSESKAFFRSSDLSKTLQPGELQPFSVPQRSFSLALSPDVLSKVEETRMRCGVEFKNVPLVSENQMKDEAAPLLSDILVEGGYVQLAGDDSKSWWIPSSMSKFSDSMDSERELQSARQSFYTPRVLQDIFGNVSRIGFDQYYLLAQSVEDANGSITTFENDYLHLQPYKITDPNQIVQQIMLDCFGRTVATANLGKEDQPLDADSFSGFELRIVDNDAEAVLSDPTGEIARRLLGNANDRVIHYLDRFYRWSAQHLELTEKSFLATTLTTPPPGFVVHLSRDLSFKKSNSPTVHVEVTYLNGTGAVIQQQILNDPTDVDKMWLASGSSINESHGGAVRSYQPFFSSSATYVPPSRISSNATTSFFDIAGRNVATLHANHLWSKTVVTPWSCVEHDVSDLLLCKPQEDADVAHYFARLPSTRFVPTWFDSQQQGTARDKAAANQSRVGVDSPLTVHFGSCGLVVRQVHKVDGKTHTQRFDYDVSGNRIRSFNSLNQLVEKNVYDKSSRCLISSGMENGDQLSVPDAQGQSLFSWNSTGVCFYHRFDKLRRQIEQWMYSKSEAPKLVTSTKYGEKHPEPAKNNHIGQVWQVRDQSGIYTNEAFDVRGNLFKHTFASAREYKQVLDWRKDNALDGSFPSQSTFNSLGQALEEEDEAGNSTKRNFNRLGQVKQVTFRRQGSQDWEAYLVNAEFTEDGLPSKTTYGNGVSAQYEYEPKTRQLITQRAIRTKNGRTTVIEDLSYTYDCYGRQIYSLDSSKDPAYFRNTIIKAERCFQYDGIGQLIYATGRAQLPSSSGKDVQLTPYNAMTGNDPTQAGNSANQLYNYVETYKYDMCGNITSMKHEAPSDPNVRGWTRQYFYEQPSLLSDDSKVCSNLLSRTVVGATEERYRYDGEEKDGYQYDYEGTAGKVGCMTSLPKYSRLTWNMYQMLSSSSTQSYDKGTPEITYYVYNCEGHRVRKVTESAATSGSAAVKKRDTLYLDGVEIQAEISSNNGTATRWIASVDSSERIALVETTNKEGDSILRRYQIGSGFELDDTGQLISYEEYSPYGAVVFSATQGTVQASRLYRFARYRHDRETGLYHCGARYYCPWLGRWTSPDPLGDVDGPNILEYCSNDPVNYSDHSGTSRTDQNKTKDVLPAIKTRSISRPKPQPPSSQDRSQSRARSVKRVPAVTSKNLYRGEVIDHNQVNKYGAQFGGIQNVSMELRNRFKIATKKDLNKPPKAVELWNEGIPITVVGKYDAKHTVQRWVQKDPTIFGGHYIQIEAGNKKEAQQAHDVLLGSMVAREKGLSATALEIYNEIPRTFENEQRYVPFRALVDDRKYKYTNVEGALDKVLANFGKSGLTPEAKLQALDEFVAKVQEMEDCWGFKDLPMNGKFDYWGQKKSLTEGSTERKLYLGNVRAARAMQQKFEMTKPV